MLVKTIIIFTNNCKHVVLCKRKNNYFYFFDPKCMVVQIIVKQNMGFTNDCKTN